MDKESLLVLKISFWDVPGCCQAGGTASNRCFCGLPKLLESFGSHLESLVVFETAQLVTKLIDILINQTHLFFFSDFSFACWDLEPILKQISLPMECWLALTFSHRGRDLHLRSGILKLSSRPILQQLGIFPAVSELKLPKAFVMPQLGGLFKICCACLCKRQVGVFFKPRVCLLECCFGSQKAKSLRHCR